MKEKRLKVMLKEEDLLNKYSDIGILSINLNEIYLPLNARFSFIADCTKNEIAIIGLDFFDIQNNRRIAYLDAYDFSSFVYGGENWISKVEICNQAAMNALNHEEQINSTRYFCPTLDSK
jgi:hypothetical protein